MKSTDTILLLALGIAGFVAWRSYRLHQLGGAVGPTGQPPAVQQPGDVTPSNISGQPIAIGQFAVARDKRWLLLPYGQS